MRALTDEAKDNLLGGPGVIMGGINFAWLAVCVLSPDWLSSKLGYATFSSRLGEAAAPGGRGGGKMRAVTDFASYTLTYAIQLRKITEKPQSVLSALNAIRLIHWRQATGQHAVSISICRITVIVGSPHQITLSQSLQSGL
jgi:hypothetical protein